MNKTMIALSLSALLLAGCEYKPLCYDFEMSGTGTLIFDWKGDTTCVTSYMKTVFHGDKEDDVRSFDMPGRDGGAYRLMPGAWTPVAWNGDAEAILMRGTGSPETYIAYTRTTSVKSATRMESRGEMPQVKAPSEPVIVEPDPLWFGLGDPVWILPNREAEDRTVVMEPRTITIDVTIHDVPNLKWTTQYGGALSGLASGVNCADGVPLGDPATEAFYMYSPADSTLNLNITSFGLCPEKDGSYPQNHLTVYLILGDGTQWYCVMDITEALRGAPFDERTLTLSLDLYGGIPVPAPVSGSSGFLPTIDEWYGVEIELSMNPNPK